MSTEATRIVNGIEWYDFQCYDRTETDCQCARCGSSAGWRDCESGFHWIDDDDPDCEAVDCPYCDNKGGRWHCLSGREWCERNPMAGREHIESTALKGDA